MATSINGYTFMASANGDGTLITVIAHKDDDGENKTEVFKFSTADANDLCDMLKYNCKLAKDRRKAVKKTEKEEEPCRDKSPAATTAATPTASSSPSRSGESSASTPKKKDGSSSKKSGTGAPAVALTTTVVGDTPRKARDLGPTYGGVPPGYAMPSKTPLGTIATAKRPWTVQDHAPARIWHGEGGWSCEVRCTEEDGEVNILVKKIVDVLNDPLPLSDGRYTSYSYTEIRDNDAAIVYQFHWGSEHSEFPAMYPLAGMLNTLEEKRGKCAV